MEYGKVAVKLGNDLEERRKKAMEKLSEDIRNTDKENAEFAKKTLLENMKKASANQ